MKSNNSVEQFKQSQILKAQFGTGLVRRGWNWLKNAAQVAAIAENPTVMTAAGWRVDSRTGKAIQDKQNDKEVKQLRRNLATIGKAQTIAHDNYTGSPHQLIGTIQGTQPNSSIIGSFYKNRSEQMVYTHPTNPNLVTKVYADKDFSNGFPSVEAIKNFHKSFMKRNQVPIQERVNYQGYLQNESGSLFPVYTQTKVNEFDNKMPWQVYEQDIEPIVDNVMGKHGFKKTKDGNYTNGKITVTDVSPENIGYTNNGDMRFFDTYVYKSGGRMSHQ